MSGNFSFLQKFLLFLFVLSVFSFIRPSDALALDACKGIKITATPPGALYDTSSNATFTIDVDGTAGYKGWQIGIPNCNQNLDATILPDGKSVSVNVENSYDLLALYGKKCVFEAGIHKLEATAIRNNGTQVKICEANYNVLDSTAQCKLTVATDPPGQGITPASTVLVSGSNLIPRSTYNLVFGYALFLDGKEIGTNVDTRGQSTFSGFKIPSDKLTQGSHTVDLTYPGVSFWGTDVSLCSITFTVGTPNNPGSVINQSSGGINPAAPKPCTGDGCTIASGKQCGDDKSNPAISTAIGCIHTNPVSFTGDLLKFLTAIGGGFAFLLMLLGAFQMISSAGNPETLQAGRDRFTYALIGLLLVIFAVLLMKIIGVDILCIPGFDARCK